MLPFEIENLKMKSLSITSSIPTKTTDRYSEKCFMRFVGEKKYSDAADLLMSLGVETMPSENMMRAIIFKMLMKCDDKKAAAEAKTYLLNILEVYPPSNEFCRLFYYNALRAVNDSLSDFWVVFSYIVKSCMVYYGVYENLNTKPIRYPNCILLLDIYIKVLSQDFELLNNQRNIYAKYNTVLVKKMLWPKGDINKSKNNTGMLMKWLNDVYSSPDVEAKCFLLSPLHELLELMIKLICWKDGLSDIEALSHPSLLEIVVDIMNICKDFTNSLQCFNFFMSNISLKCLQIRVSEKIMAFLYHHTTRIVPHLTLKKIVDIYMFPSKDATRKTLIAKQRPQRKVGRDSRVIYDSREAPSFKQYKNYSIYLHALSKLLCCYSHVFHLYDYMWNTIEIGDHESKNCCHYTEEYSVCSDDAHIIETMPDLIDDFIKSVRDRTIELNLNIEMELIPLRSYRTSLLKNV